MNYANCDNNTDLVSGVRQATKCAGAKDSKYPKDPKNAAIIDYRIATGMEALVGYLYLSGKDERLSQLMRIALHDTAEIAEQAEK